MSEALMDAMARRIQALESRNAALVAMLREVEFVPDDYGHEHCPICHERHHEPDSTCRLAALIREGEGK